MTSFRWRKRIYYRNSFQYSLSGKIIEENGQTGLRCKIALHPLVRAFFAFWFGGVLLFGGATLVKTIGELLGPHGPLPANWWLGVVISLLLPAGGAAIFGLGRYLARNEPDFLIDLVRRTVDGR